MTVPADEPARLPLIGGGYALIDPDLFNEACRYRWRRERDHEGRLKGSGHVYACGAQTRPIRTDPRAARVSLARWASNIPKGRFVQHRNGEVTDCRRENLKSCATKGEASVPVNEKRRAEKWAADTAAIEAGTYRLRYPLKPHRVPFFDK